MKKTMILITLTIVLMLTGISFSIAENNSGTGKQSNDSNVNYTAAVATILKNYNAETLTSTDARAINDAFRQAGVRQGEAQKTAIKAAGFDPQKISSLDPPPEKNGEPNMNQKNKKQNR